MSNHDGDGSRPFNYDREGSGPSDRDAALQRAWRAASAEQPPSHLDAAIIAAARRSVPDRVERPHTVAGTKAWRNRLTQWQPLAAAAAVTGLAFVLVQMLPREQMVAPSVYRKESVAEPAAPDRAPMQQVVPAPPTTPEAQSMKAEKRATHTTPTVEASATHTTPTAESLSSDVAATAGTAGRDSAKTTGATASDAPPPAEAASAATADTAAAFGESSANRRKEVATQSGEQSTTAATAAGASPALARSAPAPERQRSDAAPLDPTTWAARIEALHASGEVTAAEHELRAFRAAHADADSHLPDTLRGWAGTVE